MGWRIVQGDKRKVASVINIMGINEEWQMGLKNLNSALIIPT
jgi:hypothetical protein